ncbi:MAG: hypothetical protein K2L10_02750 [Ruminococcus sp.]|nr:hypothetical protein [Ruminococcus sp.]
MKYIIKNIKSFIRTEKIIFILILICIIASSFIINFSYGLYQNYHVIKEEEESDLYSFEITFNNDLNGDYASKGVLKNTLMSFSDSLNDSIDMYFVMPYSDEINVDDYGNMIVRFCIKDGNIAPCELFKKNMQKNGTLMSGEYFSEEQEKNGENVALAFVEDSTGTLKDNGTLSFQGKEYKVIGTQRMHSLIVPFESLNSDTPINDLLFNFVKPLTRSQYDEIKEKISDAFGELAVIPELDIPESENYYLYNTIIIISVLIALLSAINFAVLYKYILSKRTKSLSVFRICGCTKFKALGMFLSECMIITIPVFALTSLCYDKFILPALAVHFEYIESAYSMKLYLIIFAIYVLSSLIVLGIMIYFSFLRKTIKESWGGI